jgi:phospholipase/carboxylesterase
MTSSRSKSTCQVAVALTVALGCATANAEQPVGQQAPPGRAASSGAPVQRPAVRPTHLVIFLHGLRGSGSVMAPFGTSWQKILGATKFVSPDAPFRHRGGGREWFDVNDQVLRPDRIAGARQAFDDLVGAIVEREGFENDLDKVAFVGVSQGAIMGLDAVASGRWKVGAVVSFAGLLPLPPAASARETAVLLLHGGADQRIPATASVAAANQLKSAGFDVTLEVVPGVGHTISSEEAAKALRFLAEHFQL